eukprot:5964155-Karenia_brevis.AAC.1
MEVDDEKWRRFAEKHKLKVRDGKWRKSEDEEVREDGLSQREANGTIKEGENEEDEIEESGAEGREAQE